LERAHHPSPPTLTSLIASRMPTRRRSENSVLTRWNACWHRVESKPTISFHRESFALAIGTEETMERIHSAWDELDRPVQPADIAWFQVSVQGA
jgi:hypothetical protein